MNWGRGQNGAWDGRADWQYEIRPQQQNAHGSYEPYNGPLEANIFGSSSSKPSNGRGDSQQSSQPSYRSYQSDLFGNSNPRTVHQRGSAFAPSQQCYRPSQGDAFGSDFRNPGSYFRDEVRSSQPAYGAPQATRSGSDSRGLSSQGRQSFTSVPQASQESQAASRTGVGQRYYDDPAGKDELPVSVYEALVRIQQEQVLALATELAKEKVRSNKLRAWLAIRAENAAASRPPAQRAAAQKERTYGFKFTQHRYAMHILHGYAGNTTIATLLQEYARRTSQDLNDLELFYNGMMVNLGLKLEAWKGKWLLEVRTIGR